MIPTTPHPLHNRLLDLPFDAFSALVARLLPKLGYESVQPAGRRDFRGRNGRDGATGYDLLAKRDGRPVLIQLKQFQPGRLLFQRSLDELRGVALRRGASQALLITTSDFSKGVDRVAHRLAPIAPIATLSGEQLVHQLLTHAIGAREDGSIDEALFAQLSKDALGNGPADCTGGSTILVTVGVRRIPAR
jgi:restriction endonuclease Mrr